MLSKGTVVRTIGLHDVQAKLIAAQPRILANNMAMTKAMLDWVKVEEVAATPVGPGHFGYHGRDTVRVTVIAQGGHTVLGQLRGAVQLYWREYGTGSHARRIGRIKLTAHESKLVGLNIGGGERAFMTAHRALSGARAIIRAFYSKALWWRL